MIFKSTVCSSTWDFSCVRGQKEPKGEGKKIKGDFPNIFPGKTLITAELHWLILSESLFGGPCGFQLEGSTSNFLAELNASVQKFFQRFLAIFELSGAFC